MATLARDREASDNVATDAAWADSFAVACEDHTAKALMPNTMQISATVDSRARRATRASVAASGALLTIGSPLPDSATIWHHRSRSATSIIAQC